MSEQSKIIELSLEQVIELSTAAHTYLAKKIDTKLARALKVKIEPQVIKIQKKYAVLREDICRKYAATGDVNGGKNIVLKNEKGEYIYEKTDQASADDEINKLYTGESGVLYKITHFFTEPPSDLEISDILIFKGIVIDPNHPMCSEEYLLNPREEKAAGEEKQL